jgi:hypothetical protein
MKNPISLFLVPYLFLICGMAFAAPPGPSSVNVINTASNPVPVNFQQKTTRILYSQVTTASSYDETQLNVSTCSQIRITVAGGKNTSGSVSLWELSSPDNPDYVANLFNLELATTPYGSEVLDTPGDSLTLDVAGGDRGLFVRVFCR